MSRPRTRAEPESAEPADPHTPMLPSREADRVGEPTGLEPMLSGALTAKQWAEHIRRQLREVGSDPARREELTATLLSLLRHNTLTVRRAAAAAFQWLRPLSGAVLNPLADRLAAESDEQVCSPLGDVLSRLGRAALPMAYRLLSSGAPVGKAGLTWALGHLCDHGGADDDPEPLILYLSHADPAVRLLAVRAVVKLLPGGGAKGNPDWRRPSSAMLAAMSGVLRDAEHAVRELAVEALLNWPPVADEVLNAARSFLSGSSPTGPSLTARIGRLRPVTARQLEVLCGGLVAAGSWSSDVVAQTCHALRGMAREALPIRLRLWATLDLDRIPAEPRWPLLSRAATEPDMTRWKVKLILTTAARLANLAKVPVPPAPETLWAIAMVERFAEVGPGSRLPPPSWPESGAWREEPSTLATLAVLLRSANGQVRETAARWIVELDGWHHPGVLAALFGDLLSTEAAPAADSVSPPEPSRISDRPN